MSLKKITSLVLLISFFIVLFSTIALYIGPWGFYSSWGGWKFLFMGKGLWRDLHVTIGFIFLFFLILHIYYNIRLIVSYLRKKGSAFISKEFSAAILFILISSIGTAYEVQPFKGIIDLGSHIRRSWMVKYSRPPYRHAEYSTLKVFSMRTGIKLDTIKKNLQNKGYKNINENSTLAELASVNRTSPDELYKAIIQE